MQVSVPAEKIDKAIVKINEALESTSLTLRNLQSLIGTLSFICKAIAPGRPFLRRLIDITCGVSSPNHHLKLSDGAKCDLKLWLLFLEKFNGVSMIPDQVWTSIVDIQFFTDSSGEACGGFYANRWFQTRWPGNIGRVRSIAWLELFPILVAVTLWGHLLQGKRIILRSDNMSVIAIINKQTSKCPEIMKLVRFFILQCLKFNLSFYAKHIPGKENNIADALSRFQMRRFRELAPQAAVECTPVPGFLWNL